MPERLKSYEELRADRQREWYAAQAKAGAELAERHAALARMPDVKLGERLKPGSLYSEEGLCCARCKNESFQIFRYVTVNGIRHRGEFKCLFCSWLDTWDWETKRWMRS